MDPEGAVRLWCNIGETGEAGGLLEVIGQLRDRLPGLSVILTAGRSVQLPDPLPLRVGRAPKPYDLPQIVERFLDEHRPGAMLLTGSDLFPSAISACRQRGIPLFLANASFRERGRLGERLMDFRLGARLRAFDRIFAVAEHDAEHFVRKGALRSRIDVLGTLEAMAPALSCDESEREYLTKLLRTRPVWLAAGLPEAEKETVAAAFRTAYRQAHRLLLVVQPADPAKGRELEEFFEADGWITARREDGKEPDQNVQVFVSDMPDEAGLWYRLAPITYLGGTLSGAPFPDPFHAAALGSTVIHGLNVARPSPQLDRLAGGGATRAVGDADELAAAVADLLAPDRAAALAGRAWEIASRGVESAERAAEAIAAALRGGGG